MRGKEIWYFNRERKRDRERETGKNFGEIRYFLREEQRRKNILRERERERERREELWRNKILFKRGAKEKKHFERERQREKRRALEK